MILKDRIKRAGSYKGANFFKADTIAVIARGPSSIDAIKHKRDFYHCILCGEFNNTIERIQEALLGKEIVISTWHHLRYKLSKENRSKYGIKNVQVPFYGNSDKFRDSKKFYKDLNVTPYTEEHRDIAYKVLGSSLYFATTGVGGIISALYFNPKKIMIFGIDFYYTGEGNKGVYLCKEKKDVNLDINSKNTINSIQRFRVKMINAINSVSRYYPDIELEMYTTFKGIVSKRNLKVNYV